MSKQPQDLIIVLVPKINFEKFVGSVPVGLKAYFRFVKPHRTFYLKSLLPRCKLMISKSYITPLINLWILKARRKGIPTLLLVDGPLEWTNSHCNPNLHRRYPGFHCALYDPLIHDAVATIGDAQTHWLRYRNESRGITFVSQTNRRLQKSSFLQEKEGMKPQATRDFLVTTAKTPYFNEKEKRDLVTALKRCCDTIEAEGYSYLLRIFDRELQTQLPDHSLSTEGDSAQAMSQCRCVIGTSSSILLEAMDQRKPTATLVFRDTPLFYQTGWLLGCAVDWRGTLRSMTEMDSKRMDFQRFVLRENLSEEDFFDHCEKAIAGEILRQPRPMDIKDLEFENIILHKALGWRAKVLAPIVRGLRKLRGAA